MLWRSCWRWLELLRFNRVPGGCADERISRWVLTTQTTQVPNAHLDSEKVELQGPNSAQQHHNTTIVTGLEALSCQGGIWPQRRSVGAGKGNVLSYWPSMGACVVLCKMLSATTFKREKEGGEREEDDHEFTLASSCAFPNVNLKMKGTAGQNEKYRGIKHTTVKGGEKKKIPIHIWAARRKHSNFVIASEAGSIYHMLLPPLHKEINPVECRLHCQCSSDDGDSWHAYGCVPGCAKNGVNLNKIQVLYAKVCMH